MRTFLFTISTLFFLLTSGCLKVDSDTLDQNNIWASYELFYDKEEGKTHATAVFKVENEDGNYVSLSPPSVVTFQGDTLWWSHDWTTYHKEYDGKIESGEFVWTGVEGVTRRYFTDFLQKWIADKTLKDFTEKYDIISRQLVKIVFHYRKVKDF